jgi:hypothetical protein
MPLTPSSVMPEVDPALRFEKWENLDLISKNRLITFLQVLVLLLMLMIPTLSPFAHHALADATAEAIAPRLRYVIFAAERGRV